MLYCLHSFLLELHVTADLGEWLGRTQPENGVVLVDVNSAQGIKASLALGLPPLPGKRYALATD